MKWWCETGLLCSRKVSLSCWLRQAYCKKCDNQSVLSYLKQHALYSQGHSFRNFSMQLFRLLARFTLSIVICELLLLSVNFTLLNMVDMAMGDWAIVRSDSICYILVLVGWPPIPIQMTGVLLGTIVKEQRLCNHTAYFVQWVHFWPITTKWRTGISWWEHATVQEPQS